MKNGIILHFYKSFWCVASQKMVWFSSLLPHWNCCHMLFWLKYMNKILPHTDMWLEKEGPGEWVLCPHFENHCPKLTLTAVFMLQLTFCKHVVVRRVFQCSVIITWKILQPPTETDTCTQHRKTLPVWYWGAMMLSKVTWFLKQVVLPNRYLGFTLYHCKQKLGIF